MGRIERFATKSESSFWKLTWNVTWGIAAVVIETLAAMTLDGWLSLLLWILAIKNTVILMLVMTGLMSVAVEREKETPSSKTDDHG